MSKILVTGATGLVGSRVVELLSGHEIYKFSSHPGDGLIVADLLDFQSFENACKDLAFDTILNFAAYTNVDGAEKERGQQEGSCYGLNTKLAENLAKFASEKKAKLIHISTDFVFDGQNGPYSETDKVANVEKIGWYGATKLMGEEAIAQNSSNYQIIRIAYPFRNNFEKTDFARGIIERFRSNSLYPLFSDQFLTPTFVDNLAGFINFALEKDLQGIFHCAIDETTTPYEFAKKIATVFGFNRDDVKEGSFVEFAKNNPDRAPRPLKGGLKIDKIKSLGFKTLSIDEALKTLKAQIS